MKKLLLLSVAVVVSLSTSVFANVQELVKTNPLQSEGLSQNQANLRVVKNSIPATLKSSSGVLTTKSNLYRANTVSPLAEGDLMAAYLPPTMFYWGFTTDFGWKAISSTQGVTFYLGPAYVDQTWTNYSTGASGYSWSYIDPAATAETPQEDLMLTSTSTDLTVSYPYNQYQVPTLTAYGASGSSDEYYYGYAMQTGGRAYSVFNDGTDAEYGAAMFDYGATYYGQSYLGFMFDDTKVIAGNFKAMFDNAGATDVHSSQWGVLYPNPAAPYAISKLWLMVAADNLPAGTEIEAEIYALEETEEGYVFPEEPMAHAVFSTSVNMSDAQNYSFLTFDVVYDDPITGLEVSGVPVTIDSPIAILFPFEQEGYTVYPVVASAPMDLDVPSYDIYIASYKLNGEDRKYITSFPWAFGSEDPMVMTSYILMTDAAFGWFFPESDRVESTEGGDVVTATTTGETITIPFNSYYYSTATTSSIWSEDGAVDWLDYSLGENEEEVTELTINVDALPSGVTGRKCTITFTPTGSAPYKLTIGQGTVGVESAVVTSAARVSVVGGNFVVNAPETINAVTVYNVAGQAVATSEIAGTTTVDAQSLAKGVYVLRFNDGSTVKVIK